MKSNTNEVRKQLVTLLKTITTNVYYDNVPKPAVKPYIVLELQELNNEGGKTSCTLEVNCVAQKQAAVLDMADRVQDLLDGEIINTNKLLLYCFRGSRKAVEEEDKSIERIRLMIDLYVYSREEN